MLALDGRYDGMVKLDLSLVPEADREEAEKLAAELAAAALANPLSVFEPHCAEQERFLAAATPVVAAFCGNQCLATGTPVRMADGSTRAIEDIHVGDAVVGADMAGSTRASLVTAVHDNGLRACSTYSFGKRGASASFTATADHKLLASPERRAWRVAPAGRLKPRCLVMRQTGMEPLAGADPDEEHAMLVGLLLGDGCLTGPPVAFTCAEPHTLEAARAEAARLGCRVLSSTGNAIQYRIARLQGAGGPNPVRELVNRMGMACYAHEKTLPPQVAGWSNVAVGRLLGGLLLTDGTVGTATHAARGCHGVVGFTSTSRTLVQGLKDLMELRFGVYGSRVIENLRPDKHEARTEYSWQVSNYVGLRRLQAAVPLVGPKQARLGALLANWAGKRSDGAELLFRGAVPAGPQRTYDLTIDHPSHLFALANGLIVSNSGKSTIGAVKALLQLVPSSLVPEHLSPYRAQASDGAVHGWALCPTEGKIFDSLLPAIRKWCPPEAFKGGDCGRAFNGERMSLAFEGGSTLAFHTYKQQADTLGGATLHFVWYDEPPPRAHRDEAATRLLATGGPEWYTMTPLKSHTGWIRKEIWRNREDPQVTVCKWSMHDNPALDAARVTQLLDSYKNDLWRRAREFGDFMDIAGLVYADFERCVVPNPVPRAQLKQLEHVWGIDPGIRNAAIVCGGFDSHGVDHIYDERLIQNGTPTQYAQAIDVLLAQYRLHRGQVTFVIDPAARQRSQVTGDTVQNELARLGIYTMNGNNSREAGQQQIRDRILHRRLQVYSNCVGLRDDADEFSWEIDDEDDIGPADDSPYHRLATLRYQVMVRPFQAHMELNPQERRLGARALNEAIDLRHLRPLQESGPHGPLS